MQGPVPSHLVPLPVGAMEGLGRAMVASEVIFPQQSPLPSQQLALLSRLLYHHMWQVTQERFVTEELNQE